MSDKRIFYITANRLVVYWSLGRTIREDVAFTATEQGVEEFSKYLLDYTDISSLVLLDVLDEEFRVDSMPHVFGRDRLAVQNRKLKQAFHTNHYRGIEIQGREKNGRRDNKILMTALSNTGPFEQWLDAMLKRKTPISGIFSLPMLANFFIEKLKISSENTLLIVPQKGDMIRQIFLHQSALKTSRLLPIKRHDRNSYHKFIINEALKNQRYLQRLRLLAATDIMVVYVLCESKQIAALNSRCTDTATIHYNFISIDEAVEKLELSNRVSIDKTELLFVHLLSKRQPIINYAHKQQRHYATLYRTRKALVAASMLMVFGFMSLTGHTILNALELKQKTIDLGQQSHILLEKYKIVAAQLPDTDISPRNMQTAVNIVQSLGKHKTNPQLMMANLSKGLSSFPNIQINEIRWLSSNQPFTAETTNNDNDDLQQQAGLSFQNRYQIASIMGQLKFFQGNYQSAFATIKKFVNTLKNDPRFTEVTVIKYPIDIDSSSTLSMTSGKNTKYHVADFEISVVMKVNNEST